MANRDGWRCKSCGRDLGTWSATVDHMRTVHQVNATSVAWTIERPQRKENEQVAVALIDDIDLQGIKMEHTVRVWVI